jgi:hypothetical protein
MVISFKNSKVANIRLLTKPENKYLPLKKVVDDDKILKGFIWKPKDRPVSKESIIPSHRKTATKPGGSKPNTKGKPAAPVKSAPADSLKRQLTIGKDSLLKADTSRARGIKAVKDSIKMPTVIKPVTPVKDTVKTPAAN